MTRQHFALILAFALTGACTAALLPWLRSLRIRRDVRIDTPDTHQVKQGTPSMGGIAILAGAVITIVALERSTTALLPALAMAFFGGIGFWDDFVKATGKDNRGIKARHKLLWQLIGCLLFFLSLWHFRGGAAGDHSLLQEVAYFLWTTLVIIATCNAANVTDGLDGLAAGLTVIAAASLGGVAIVLQRQEIAVCCFALAGASAGFLLYNTRRAMIFMGDTGSLAIGAGLAASALAMECELLVPLVALPFVIDALSVLLQVVAFKTTGRRIFRMAPIHHGFELRGWSEWRVVLSFWIVGAVCAGLAVVYFDALIEIEALGWAR